MESFIAIAIIFIFLVFIFALVMIIRTAIRENKQLENLSSALNEANIDNIHEKHFLISDKIYELYSGEPIAKYWKEFEESLVIDNDYIENTLDASHFFNVRSLCPNIFESEIYKWVPSALIGIGVLFTFIGLVYGLSGLNVNSDDIDILKNGVQQILDGASIAFKSSIFGVFFSLVFAFAEKGIKTYLRKAVIKLQNLVDFKYPRTNPEKSLVQIRDYSKSTEEHMGALSEKLGSKLQEVVRDMSDSLTQGIKESLESSIGPYMEQIANKAMNSSETAFGTLIDEFLEKVGNAGVEQQEMIIKVNKEIQESLIEFREKFTDQVSGLKDSIENLNMSYHFIEEKLVENFDGAINNLNVAINGQLELKTMAENQFSEQIEFVLQTRESLGNYLNGISQVQTDFERLIQSFMITTDNLEITNANNEEINRLVAETSSQLKEPFSELRNEYAAMRSEVETNLNQLSGQLKKMMDNYFNQVEQQTNSRMNEWNQQTYEFSKSMVDVTRQFNYVIEELNKNGKAKGN